MSAAPLPADPASMLVARRPVDGPCPVIIQHNRGLVIRASVSPGALHARAASTSRQMTLAN